MKSIEMCYLLATAILTGVLWIPYVIGLVKTRGFIKPQDYVTAPDGPLPDWVNRANRAHINAVENLAPFAVIVLVAAQLDYSTQTTVLLATTFFWLRLAHAVIHISGFSRLMARTVVFSVANIAMIVYGALVIMQLG